MTADSGIISKMKRKAIGSKTRASHLWSLEWKVSGHVPPGIGVIFRTNTFEPRKNAQCTVGKHRNAHDAAHDDRVLYVSCSPS